MGEKTLGFFRDVSSYIFVHPQIAASHLHNAPGRVSSWFSIASIKNKRAGSARVLMRGRTQWMAPSKCSAGPHYLSQLIHSYQEYLYTEHVALCRHSIKDTLMWMCWINDGGDLREERNQGAIGKKKDNDREGFWIHCSVMANFLVKTTRNAVIIIIAGNYWELLAAKA